MGTSNPDQPLNLRPGEALGLFMSIAVIFGVVVFVLQMAPLPQSSMWKIAPSNRFTALAAWLAVVGTIGSAWVAVLNVVKQHTINTLLQSRLSETYMAYGERVVDGIEQHAADKGRKGPPHCYTDRDALRYVLNYYEYIAVGIKYGDLSEDILRDTLRGNLVRTTEKFAIYIAERQRGDPNTYANLMSLYERWR